MEISFQRNSNPKKLPDKDNIGFARHFSDHMFCVYYENNRWKNPQIIPFQDFKINPAAKTLHYGQEIFEGLKAFRREDGKIYLFRPEQNAIRMNNSAEIMKIPSIDEKIQLKGMQKLLETDQRWIPSGKDTALYIRPYIFGTQGTLGVNPSETYTYSIIIAPTGPYFAKGFSPIRLWVTDTLSRAGPGGTGAAKAGGNYASSLAAIEHAKTLNCNQALFVNITERYVEECGSNHIYIIKNGKLVTPKLTDTILPGITRNSLMQLAPHLNPPLEVEERTIPLEELLHGILNKEVTEFGGMGTAAAVVPVSELIYKGDSYPINDRKIGERTKQLYDALTGIQSRKREDLFNWTVPLEKLADRGILESNRAYYQQWKKTRKAA